MIETGTRGPTAHRGTLGFAAAALAGVLAGAAVLGIGELVGAILDPRSSPFFAAGATVVDHTPRQLREEAIRRFGSHDKDVLFAAMGAAMVALSALCGVLERRRRIGSAVFAVLGIAIAGAALRRPDAQWWYAIPTAAGVVAGLIALRLLLGSAGIPVHADPSDGIRLGRRRFLAMAAGVGAIAVGAAAAGRFVAQRLRDVAADRSRFVVPKPVSDVAPVSPAMTRSVPGLTAFVTPGTDFYRVDTALQVPAVSSAEWRLRIHGMVDRTVEFTMDDLRRRPAIARMITLTCVSNEVGGTLAGNAVWTGYRLADLFHEAGVHPDADMVLSRSADGFTAGTPIQAMTDGRDALLAVGMNGAPLPLEHGYPARLVVPGLYGYVSATKWVVDLEVTRFDRAQAYWTARGWAEQAPIKTASRIDVPAAFASLPAGPVVVAGVAWAQHRGIASVQVQVDDGPWHAADLTTEYSPDTWRQWTYRWQATPGTHTLRVRATDTTGTTQPAQRRPPMPDGATGRHSRTVSVR
ncbi:molybdopterin-dependent oxidoreductase [Nocardia cerradoensis]|uniref:Protein-methionine-sulfoxide reductase catalytic subunit MsrP n=1 Tax=Nocardia cerradoensis TaxID=85688 RepID=A0A231HBE9_9NOCA|nr:molybdopterin-dependent oxidoreductase [Nocardia cerradoensis]NKY46823.1 molybdopterin-dependent oxidoreductase [Nocardia cerradoensis]OXR46191.1 Protein-methionine-sulfoxide reductase catalytic subunit MsrP [Nocardia cerradoensis]